MRELNIRPLLISHLGFDRLFDELQRTMSSPHAEPPSYPPYNVIKYEDGYIIEVAVAGFKKSDINVELNRKEGCMLITSAKSAEKDVGELNGPVFIKRSLARRAFSLSFNVSQELEVREASLEDGILTVVLKTVKRPEDEPLLIPIK
jgi:molecular chaperone IbpA